MKIEEITYGNIFRNRDSIVALDLLEKPQYPLVLSLSTSVQVHTHILIADGCFVS